MPKGYLSYCRLRDHGGRNPKEPRNTDRRIFVGQVINIDGSICTVVAITLPVALR
jgi:hypothetical protein